MCMVWHVDKYEITFIYQFQENLLQPGINDARDRYQAAARQLRNTALDHATTAISLSGIQYAQNTVLGSVVWRHCVIA